MNMNTHKVYNIVMLGPSKVGKTCLITQYSKNEHLLTYEPTILGNEICAVTHRGKYYQLQVYDTSGDEDNQNRKLCYEGADLFIICFSVVDPVTLERLQEFWFKELDEVTEDFVNRQDICKVLVGTHLDLREDSETILDLKKNGMFPVSYELGENVAKKHGCHGYFETISQQNAQKGIHELFEYCIDLLNGAIKKTEFNKKMKKEKKKTNSGNSSKKKTKKKKKKTKKKRVGLFSSMSGPLKSQLDRMSVDISDDELDDILM